MGINIVDYHSFNQFGAQIGAKTEGGKLLIVRKNNQLTIENYSRIHLFFLTILRCLCFGFYKETVLNKNDFHQIDMEQLDVQASARLRQIFQRLFNEDLIDQPKLQLLPLPHQDFMPPLSQEFVPSLPQGFISPVADPKKNIPSEEAQHPQRLIIKEVHGKRYDFGDGIPSISVNQYEFNHNPSRDAKYYKFFPLTGLDFAVISALPESKGVLVASDHKFSQINSLHQIDNLINQGVPKSELEALRQQIKTNLILCLTIPQDCKLSICIDKGCVIIQHVHEVICGSYCIECFQNEKIQPENFFKKHILVNDKEFLFFRF